ncbi:MAG: hypothetical protein CMN30_06615 [Sandaracinus sp.]|nr:hypothetical protein [Sandaracinus sp.]
MRWWITAGLALAAGCASDAVTQVVVVLEADEGVEAAARDLRVEVLAEDGRRTLREVTLGETAAARWPFRVPLVPYEGDAERRVSVVAEVHDDVGTTVGVQRVETRFAAGETRYLTLRFSDACGASHCPAGQTCREGDCATACLVGAATEDGEPSAGPCFDHARLDGGAGDAAADDAAVGD